MAWNLAICDGDAVRQRDKVHDAGITLKFIWRIWSSSITIRSTAIRSELAVSWLRITPISVQSTTPNNFQSDTQRHQIPLLSHLLLIIYFIGRK